jgi:glycerol kinase
MSYIASLDQGTSSTRCMIFDQGGNVIGRDQIEHSQINLQAGWVEHDASEIWSNSQAVIKGALKNAGINGDQIAALGITNQRETIVAWDIKTGEPLHNAIVWQDTRTADFLTGLSDAVKENLVHQTGLATLHIFQRARSIGY